MCIPRYRSVGHPLFSFIWFLPVSLPLFVRIPPQFLRHKSLGFACAGSSPCDGLARYATYCHTVHIICVRAWPDSGTRPCADSRNVCFRPLLWTNLPRLWIHCCSVGRGRCIR